MKRRSLITLIACSTLAGLVVSVSTAWFIAWTEGPGDFSNGVMSGKSKRKGVQVAFTASFTRGIARYEVRELESPVGFGERREIEPVVTLADWADFRPDAALTTIGYGWPLPCMKGRTIIGGPANFTIEGWWQFGQPANLRSMHWLPLIPIASGLFINTLAVAVPLVLLVVGARYGVSENRRRAGRCVGCGYDLTGTPNGCPECGAVREARPLPPDAAAT